MTIKVEQTCDRCKTVRTVPYSGGASGQKTFSPLQGGWRPFGNKDVCPSCMNDFLKELD